MARSLPGHVARRLPRMPGLDVLTLRDGGQEAEEIARVRDFIRPARRSLELALYDVRLPDPVGAIVADELRGAADRGVTVRLAYNADVEAPRRSSGQRRLAALHPPRPLAPRSRGPPHRGPQRAGSPT